MFQKFYSEFLKSHQGNIHMAAHSHHFWPDVARKGHMEAYDRSVQYSDQKWDYIFSKLIPDVQKTIASILNYSRPQDIAFASNTHELFIKVISCFFHQNKIRILTTKSEFHSFSRQLNRLIEAQKVEVEFLDPSGKEFGQELDSTLTHKEFDLIFLSHVFFDTGYVLPDTAIDLVCQKKKDAVFILDAYHGFCALPTDLSRWENEIYYMAGGYKYAQAGEGMCFLTLPRECKLRPLITGWMAGHSQLESEQATPVHYENNGFRFWGSTMDTTSFYRFRAVWKFFEINGVSVENLDQYIKSLQAQFLNNNPLREHLLNTDLSKQGHFIPLNCKSSAQAKELHNQLVGHGVLTDFRGRYLRFGFGAYLDQESIEQVLSSLKLLKL